MDFKKYGVVYILLFLVAVVFVGTRLLPNVTSLRPVPSLEPTPVIEIKTLVNVTMDFGSEKKSYSDVVATNAYQALVEAGKKDSLEIIIKQYSFGVLVEGIGQYKNSPDKAWVYYVNGISGDTASDKKELNGGDYVEWKYVKPL